MMRILEENELTSAIGQKILHLLGFLFHHYGGLSQVAFAFGAFLGEYMRSKRAVAAYFSASGETEALFGPSMRF
jgi:hypothetical protein